MDEYTTSIFVNDDDPAPNARDHEDPSEAEPRAPASKGIRNRVAALRDKAAIQDRLLEKFVCPSQDHFFAPFFLFWRPPSPSVSISKPGFM